jgi:hypothetical protein
MIAVLGVDQVRESYHVILLGYHAVEVDERSRHPIITHGTRSVGEKQV